MLLEHILRIHASADHTGPLVHGAATSTPSHRSATQNDTSDWGRQQNVHVHQVRFELHGSEHTGKVSEHNAREPKIECGQLFHWFWRYGWCVDIRPVVVHGNWYHLGGYSLVVHYLNDLNKFHSFQFNFVCDRDHYVNHLISVSAIGLTVVTPILSHLSDKYVWLVVNDETWTISIFLIRIGRRRTLLIAFIMTAVSCFSPMLVKTLPLFAITRFIAGGVLNVNFQLPFIISKYWTLLKSVSNQWWWSIAQELVSEKYRARAACLSALAYSIGNCCLPIIIKWSRSWVNFSYVQFVMIFPFLIFYK